LLCQRRQNQVLEPDRTVVALQLERTRLAFIRCARNLQAGEKCKRDSNSAKSHASQDFHFGLLASDDYTSNRLYQSENATRGAGVPCQYPVHIQNIDVLVSGWHAGQL
jgi:hypothetical protein